MCTVEPLRDIEASEMLRAIAAQVYDAELVKVIDDVGLVSVVMDPVCGGGISESALPTRVATAEATKKLLGRDASSLLVITKCA